MAHCTHENWWSEKEGVPAWRRKLDAFPPHLESSCLTCDDVRELFWQGMLLGRGGLDCFVSETGGFRF